MNTDRIGQAIELMLKEVGGALQALNQAGAKAFQDGDYERARVLMDKGPRLMAFMEKIKPLAQEWQLISNGMGAMPAASAPATPPASSFETPPAPPPAPEVVSKPAPRQSEKGKGLLARNLHDIDEEVSDSQAYTPEEEFLVPILQALFKLGGSGEDDEVLEVVEEVMQNRLRDADYLPMPSDPELLRWHNSVFWARAAMAQEELLNPDAPIGMWQITTSGRQWLADKMSHP